MPSYKIVRELDKGFCEVVLMADNGKEEVQTYPNDSAILEKAAQHFDAEHKRLEAKIEGMESGEMMGEEIVDAKIVTVPEDLEA